MADYEGFASKNSMTVEHLKEEYHKRKERELPPERLGLDDQMTLLSIINHNIANIYMGMSKQKEGADSLMDIRNRSTLAHGTNPVTEEYWPEFRNKTKVIIENTIGRDEFGKFLSMATHGKLHIV